MALNNAIYMNNGSVMTPTVDAPKLGQTVLLYNVSTTSTTDSYPYTLPNRQYNNMFITADTWGDATVDIEVSMDGVKNWTPLTENIGGSPFTGINTNTFLPTIIGVTWLRAIVTTTTGVNISVIIC